MTGDGSVIKLISRKMINFFGYYKETNHIGITSVGFERAAIFLSKKDFRVNKLYAFKGDEEINLLREGEEPSWITEDHYIEIHSLLEQNDHTPFSVLEIELINDGVINYYTGELYVKFPKGVDIKEKTMKLLETMGYYASEEIFEFCKLVNILSIRKNLYCVTKYKLLKFLFLILNKSPLLYDYLP